MRPLALWLLFSAVACQKKDEPPPVKPAAWTGVRDALWDIKYDRFGSVELYTHTADPHTAAHKSFQFLSRLFG